MKTRSLILAAILAIPSTLAITIESAFAQVIFQRPIGRSYFLPVTPSALPVFLEDSNGDSIIDLGVAEIPKPRFEFSILTELDGQPIIDQDNRSTVGFFPNAISSFSYVVDTDKTSTRLKDDQGNLLPSIQEQEIIQQIIPGVPKTVFDGDLFTQKLTLNNSGLDLGIIYKFFSEEDFISFLIPLDATINSFSFIDNFLAIDFIINPRTEPTLDSFLATNSLPYIVNQNIFGQKALVDELILLEASFSVNANENGLFSGDSQPESSIIFASQSVPEASNKISLLALGLISTKLLTKYRVKKI